MTVTCMQGAEKVKAAQQEAEAMKRETALAAAALEGRTQALARQEAAGAEAKALLAVRTKELDNREVCRLYGHLTGTQTLAPATYFGLDRTPVWLTWHVWSGQLVCRFY